MQYLMIQQEEQGRLANVILFGADYGSIQSKSIYKALNVVKPDVILLCLSPEFDLDLQDFEHIQSLD